MHGDAKTDGPGAVQIVEQLKGNITKLENSARSIESISKTIEVLFC